MWYEQEGEIVKKVGCVIVDGRRWRGMVLIDGRWCGEVRWDVVG